MSADTEPALCYCGRNHCGRTQAEGCVTANLRRRIAADRARRETKRDSQRSSI